MMQPRHVLIFGIDEDQALARRLSLACAERGFTSVFVTDWDEWSVRIDPCEPSFELMPRTRVGAAVTDRSVVTAFLFGSPRLPAVAEADAHYQAAEYDALLFGICMIAAPALTVRWAALISGYSDVPQKLESPHPLVPDGLPRLAGYLGGVEGVVYRRHVWIRTDRGTIIDASDRFTGSDARIEVAFGIETDQSEFTSFVGMLPDWVVDCDELLDILLRDGASGHRRSPASLFPDRHISFAGHVGTTIVAHLRDTTAYHLFYRSRKRGEEGRFIDLTTLYHCSDESFVAAIQEISVAPLVFARPLLGDGAFSGNAEVALSRHFSLLRALEQRRGLTLNPPSAGYTNISKVAHLLFLASRGLAVPRSIATNDPSAARSFLIEHPGPIFKSLSWLRSVATRLGSADVDRLELLPRCPTLFQEYIEGENCRVHTVFGEASAVTISSEAADYRFDLDRNRYASIQLDVELSASLIDVAERAGLALSGCDLRRSLRSNQWIVLEMNRMPAFDEYDHRSGNLVAERLLEVASKGRPPS